MEVMPLHMLHVCKAGQNHVRCCWCTENYACDYLDWPPVLSDREIPQTAAPAARLVNFAEKVTLVYVFVLVTINSDRCCD